MRHDDPIALEQGWNIYTAEQEDFTAELLESFLATQRLNRGDIESMTVEVKRRRHGTNVADAICALANTAGGLVIVGVDEKDLTLDPDHGLEPGSLVVLVNHLAETPDTADRARTDSDRDSRY